MLDEQILPLAMCYLSLSAVVEGMSEKSRGGCSTDVWNLQRQRKAKLFMLCIPSPKATLQDSKIKGARFCFEQHKSLLRKPR